MNLLPEKDYTIPGTGQHVRLRAWSMLQIEQAKARAAAAGDGVYDGNADVWSQVLHLSEEAPFWKSLDDMKAALSLGQIMALSKAIAALTYGAEDLAAFREAGAEAGDAGVAPDGEGVRNAPVGDPAG